MTDSYEPQEPGLLGVMRNQAAGIPMFTPSYDIGGQDAEKRDGMSITFSEGVTQQLKRISSDLGFLTVADFINTATSVYGQMLRAAQVEGYSQVLMVNPETEQVINVPLVSDDVPTD